MMLRTALTRACAVGLVGSALGLCASAQQNSPADQTSAAAGRGPAASGASAQAATGTAAAPAQAGAKSKHGKAPYNGPTTVIELPPAPMLDEEGKQRVDPDGHPMFNPPVKQLRDKKGHPVFDANGKPVFQTATDLGYDEKGKRIKVKKVKAPKATPVSIAAGTLTVDGWTGKARLNYDIADVKFLYFYAPGIGVSIVSLNPFPGAKEQAGAFSDRSLKITVDGHAIELASEKRLLGKKPEAAWVAVDRGFRLPSTFPAFGYGTTLRAPYTWPGSKEEAVSKGAVQAPPLPADISPALLLGPCPAGMMRKAGPATLPGQKAPEQPCVPIQATSAAAPAPAATSQK